MFYMLFRKQVKIKFFGHAKQCRQSIGFLANVVVSTVRYVKVFILDVGQAYSGK